MVACGQQLFDFSFAGHQQVVRDKVMARNIRFVTVQGGLQAVDGFVQSSLLQGLDRLLDFLANLEGELLLLR